MYGFSVSLCGLTASFREPGSHLYQATLPFPPVSALVGMAGAAFGKTFQEAWTFFKSKELCVGVSGATEGSGIDLWKYKKIADAKDEQEKNFVKLHGLSKIVRDDILNREFLVNPRFRAFYAMSDKNVAETLRAAFLDPVYALSLGASDDIARTEGVSALCDVSEGSASHFFCNTFLEGDHSQEVHFDWEALKRACVAQTLKATLVRPLIVDFKFKKEERHGSRYRLFTFLTGFQRLERPQSAFLFNGENEAMPLYRLRETD